MFAELMVKEPIERIVEDWDYFEDRVLPKFSGFKPMGQNIYGIRRRQISGETVVDPRKGNISRHFEMGPKGLSEWHQKALTVHITTSGTPHRVSHNFGYWHVNDKDEIYLPLPGEGPDGLGYFLVIMGFPRDGETDRFSWYCADCLTLLHEYVYETGRLGFHGFWRAETDAVNSFNADPRHRVCPECGATHPLAYRWNTATDTPETAAARKLW